MGMEEVRGRREGRGGGGRNGVWKERVGGGKGVRTICIKSTYSSQRRSSLSQSGCRCPVLFLSP